ncbi:phosphoribosyltransferase [Streptomyces anulatus]|uniref:ComF family protein n=1 Tax=Streptomyces TaxID=1883 RepID=UPI0006DA66F0|nr:MULTISPECIES: ComF family protein [Streptomyces]KPL34876.1 phosphoribosyltransferase [Streptomyces anulatus]KQX28984.1 phosphoribosyltransferase [Streptomyces sp. Root1295]KRA50033.1 phosphoribosyltransferase [Streptomyces sp. Root63]WSR76159.1 ComF family protein [Streptomyces anulatus]WUC88946.1 ComF family protein [Streptomyces anulatus]
MRNAWRAWQELSGLLLPVACAGCGRPRTELCTACGAALHGAPARLVRPSPRPPGLPAVYAAAPYENAVRAVLLAHKERGALGLAGVLGRALAGCVRAGAGRPGDAGPLLLVPVPSARSSTAARGHDPVRRIAAAAARDLRRAGLPAQVLPLLRQRRAVADQSGLGARQRRANLAGALELTAGGGRLVRHGLPRHELHRHGLLRLGRVILVDDLLTTGSTLAEAARAVGEAGGVGRESSVHGVCWAAVVAASPTAFEINRN